MTIGTNKQQKQTKKRTNREHKTTYVNGQEKQFDQVSHIEGIYTSTVPRVFE